jgi:hypothetical protein
MKGKPPGWNPKVNIKEGIKIMINQARKLSKIKQKNV